MKEEKVIDSNLLDSTVWLAYFFEDKHKELIESDKTLYLSILSIFEIKKKMLDRKIPLNIVNEKINFMKRRSLIINLDEKTAEDAAELSSNNHVPAIDSLIYLSAINNHFKFLTLDNDFRDLDNVKILN